MFYFATRVYNHLSAYDIVRIGKCANQGSDTDEEINFFLLKEIVSGFVLCFALLLNFVKNADNIFKT